MTYSRHTMGNDWGGRLPSNPVGCKKITRTDVLKYAADNNIEVKRDRGNFGMWYAKRKDGEFYTIGLTNFLALSHLQSNLKKFNK